MNPLPRIMDRRRFITVVAAGGLHSLLSGCDEMPASAVAAWDGPDDDVKDIRLWALSYALLAPSPHNLQSWIADVREPEVVVLYADPSRLLPETDPQNRQILIGCGAFLEQFVVACEAAGDAVEVDLFPEGEYPPQNLDSRPFARLRVRGVPGSKVDQAALEAIRRRRSAKVAFSKQEPSRGDLAALSEACRRSTQELCSTCEPQEVEALNQLAKAGYRIEFGTRRTLMESLHATRLGADEIMHDPTGIAVHGPSIWWGRRLGLLKEPLDPDDPRVLKSLERVADRVDRTPSWAWIVTGDNSRIAQIESGRAYLRVCLEATRRGLAIHPNSQVLQEFSEMAELYSEFCRRTGIAAPRRAQMLMRVGFTESTIPPTPRRALETILRGKEKTP